MSFLSKTKVAYRRMLPLAIRDSALVTRIKAKPAFHNVIYDADYYAKDVEGPAAASAATMARSLVEEFTAVAVIDVGCGTGALLEGLRDRGCQVYGLEYADAGLAFCRSRGLDVDKFDLERDALAPGRSFDVAISVEVAEHLPERVADRYVDLLTTAAPTVVFTAAPPGQDGADHVNLQPKEYWISKFESRGHGLDSETTVRLAAGWRAAGDVQSWYYENLMVFRKA